MNETALKNRMTSCTGSFLFAVLLLQPLLDVLSYFIGGGVFTMSLRLLLLFGVSLYGFVLSDSKRGYIILYSVIAGFWLLHALNLYRAGYQDPMADLSAYLKLIQFPLWTVAFLTFFRKREELSGSIYSALAINVAVIFLVVALSYAVGAPVYTYDFPERQIKIGMLGWFYVASVQSVIRTLLLPGLLLWGYRTGKLWVFSLCTAFGFCMAYFTGTRLTYFGALLTTAVFLAVILLSRKRLLFAIPMAAALLLLIVLRGVSPMEERQAVTATSFSVYQGKIDEIMGEDKDFVYREGEEIPPEIYEKISRVYGEIYGKKGVYGEEAFGRLIDAFGLEPVMKQFRYSLTPTVLNNARTRKLKAMGMYWDREDAFTHLLGMSVVDGNIYDPENDFPALVFYLGYLGTGLYCAFILWVVVRAAAGFFRSFPALFTMDFAAAACTLALALGAAQLAGLTLRWPNATVYFSLAAAELLFLAESASPANRLRSGHGENAAVTRKRIK